MHHASTLRVARQHDLRPGAPGLDRGHLIRHVASTCSAAVGVARGVGRVVDALERELVGAEVREEGLEHGRPDHGADVAALGLEMGQ